MSENLFQEYLLCYQQLSQSQYSKKANQRLLEIEDSPEAWTISYQLLSTDDNAELNLHGAQLLSKKLNVPPPAQIDLGKVLHVLYMLPQKASLIWLCIAKIMLHMSPKQPYLPQDLNVDEKIKLLKQIPAAITHIRTKVPMDGSKMKQAYLSIGIPLIINELNSNRNLVIQCLDSFVSYSTKVRNSKLVKILLSLPFQDSGHILQQILGRESYPTLQNDILRYLQSNRNEQKIYDLYVTYFKNAQLSNISFEQFRSALQFILTSLVKEDEESRTKLSQSFELWDYFAKQYIEKKLPEYVKQLIRDALLTVWKVTCKEALLQELPEKVQANPDPLALDGGDESEEPGNHYEMNKDMEYFREYAGDFFMLCYETLCVEPSALETMNSMINDLVMGQPLHLQLAIKIISSLSPANLNNLVHTAPAVAHIFERSHQMNEYMCKEVIRMIGDLGELFGQVPELLAPALQFLSNSFLFDSLAVMASSSCINLLEEMNLQKAVGLVDIMQTFMQHVYEVIFKGDCEEKVIEFLAKCMAIFVYKVKYSPQAYTAYLNSFTQRITNQPKESQPKYIQSAISAQLWINSREQLNKSLEQKNSSTFNEFMPPFAVFLENLMPLIIQLLNVTDRKVFFKRIVMISTALRTDCLGNGQVWVKLCDYILQNFLGQVQIAQVGKIIAPIINLARGAYELKILEIAVNVAKCLKRWNIEITNFLEIGLNRIDLKISSTIIYFHVRIVQLIQAFPQCAEMISYSPQQLVQYLIWVLTNKEVWEYELFKHSLQYFLIVLQLGYPPESIVGCILGNFDRLQQALWTSLDPILTFLYQRYGFGIYENILGEMKSSLADKSNPLNKVLREAFQNGEGKTIKNLLLSL